MTAAELYNYLTKQGMEVIDSSKCSVHLPNEAHDYTVDGCECFKIQHGYHFKMSEEVKK